MGRDFQRLAIVARGEPALRLVHTVRELNSELRDRPPLRVIALYTEPDRQARFVREADECVDLGADALVAADGQPAGLRLAAVERALIQARAEAVWVGWGLVVALPELAELCERLGIVFVGPGSRVLRVLSDPAAVRGLAERAQVPVAPTGQGAAAPQLTGAHSLEVQVIADVHGVTWAVGVRDCSLTLRGQKLVAEAPAAVLSPAQERALREAAVRLCQAVGFSGAGTVAFRSAPAAESFTFLQLDPGLSAEHPVTEATTGLDLVKLQLHIARGGKLEGEAPPTVGHALSVRITAEDAERDFAPAPGTVAVLRLPTGAGLRIESGVSEGDRVPPELDPGIAKLIASGRDRREALARLRRALAETLIVVRGGTTNKSFLYCLLDQPAVHSGAADDSWLDRSAASVVACDHLEVVLLAAAIESYETHAALEQAEFLSSAARGRPQVRTDAGHVAELRAGALVHRLVVFRLRTGFYLIEAGEARIEIEEERSGPFERWLTCGGRRYRVFAYSEGTSYRLEVEGVQHCIARADSGLVCSPIPAVVLAILVRPGETVAAGQRLLVLEAMKMEVPVVAPAAGQVRKIEVVANVQVAAGAPLLVLDPPVSDDLAGSSAGALAPGFAALATAALTTPGERLRRHLAMLRSLMLGFDVDRAAARRLTAEYVTLTRELPADEPDLWQGEKELIAIFADLCGLFRRQPGPDDPQAPEAVHAEEYLFTYLRLFDSQGSGLPEFFLDSLRRALVHQGVDGLARTAPLAASLLRIFKSHERAEVQVSLLVHVLERWLQHAPLLRAGKSPALHSLLDHLVLYTHGRYQALSDLAREVRYRYFEQPLFVEARDRLYAEMDDHLAYLLAHPDAADREARMLALRDCPQPLVSVLSRRLPAAPPALCDLLLEVLTRRYYRIRSLRGVSGRPLDSLRCAIAEYELDGRRIWCVAVYAEYARFAESLTACHRLLAELPAEHDVVMDFYLVRPDSHAPADTTARELQEALQQAAPPRPLRRLVAMVAAPQGERGIAAVQHFTYRLTDGGYAEQRLYRGLHPMMGKRLHLWRLSNFEIQRLPSVEDVYLFHLVAKTNPKDRRLYACAEVRNLTPVCDAAGRILRLPGLEGQLMEALAGMRQYQSQLPSEQRPMWNRVLLFIWPPLSLRTDELHELIHKLAALTEGLDIEQVMVQARMQQEGGELKDTMLRISNPGGTGLRIAAGPPPLYPMRPLSEYDQKVARMQQRGLTYPYELVRMLTPPREATTAEFPPGEFVEHELGPQGNLLPVERPLGKNECNIVVGVLRTFTARHPEGMERVLLIGDPSRAMGALAEPECRRIMAALALATARAIPVEWFALSAGAKISMDSGTENMDWISAVLRRIIEFTQAGGEVNVVVNGINVGAQPYWNAEATMLLHTRGVLIMTPQGTMVLTGKQALDYSGSVSAEDNQGIGGYERIMGPNGQAQYWARDLTEAIHILLRHYDHTYVAPGERFPRPALTTDPRERDVSSYPHGGGYDFAVVGEVFSSDKNPGRKRPFDIRKIMAAAIDQDHSPLERWTDMRDAEIAVVWDAHLGGHPVCLIGIESHPLPRLGGSAADGPDHFTAGTLFPRSSKKVARAINAASGNRPTVILANLSGFDGSPESLRELQLEYGAEIGRAVVNFRGPMVFCVVSRYHGGAYVVFSGKLNEELEIAALEGSYASVIGGTPAAAVVFAGEVEKRARGDARVKEVEAQLAEVREGGKRARLRMQLEALYRQVHSQKLGEVADEFDKIHSVQRALRVQSIHHIIPSARLRPYLIEAVERGIQRTLDKLQGA